MNEKYGLARSLSVVPGDVINAEVFVKYVDPNSSNWTSALATLMTQIAANTAGVVVDGAGYANPSTFPYVGLNGTSGSTGTGPKAYLNWLVFDKNYTFNPSLSGYMRMSTAAKEAGTNVAHERLYSPSITVTEPGYVYIYISNEELTPIEVYFDDFKVTQNMSDIVAGADYYPFGLPIPERELTREPYRYGYQGQYSEKDKETGFNFFDLRMYDARIGRWVSPNPYGQYSSGYVGMGNNPTNSVDPDGGFVDKLLNEVVVTASRLPSIASILGGVAGSIGSSLASTAIKSGFCPKCPDPIEYKFEKGGIWKFDEGKATETIYEMVDPTLRKDGWIRVKTDGVSENLNEVVVRPSTAFKVRDWIAKKLDPFVDVTSTLITSTYNGFAEGYYGGPYKFDRLQSSRVDGDGFYKNETRFSEQRGKELLSNTIQTNLSIITKDAPPFFITTTGPLNQASNALLGEGIDQASGNLIDKLLGVHKK